jgi:hypothetical protein
MPPRRSKSEVIPPPLEMIGDLVVSPGTDLPFGKQVRIGLTEQTIYESVVEKGYVTGIRAHQAFLKDHDSQTPVALDDKQFSMIIKHLLPENLTPFDQKLWRSFFIVGWTCVYLGVESADIDTDDLEDEEDNQTE